MRLLLVSVHALIALALCACSTQAPLANKSQPLMRGSTGLALASLGYVKDRESEVGTALIVVKLRRVGPDGKGDSSPKAMQVGGAIDWNEKEIVLEDASRIRALRAVELDPGDYELTSYHLAVGVLSRYTLDRAFVPAISFTVRAGEITYVGSHELRMISGKNILGQIVPSRASFVVVDRSGQDIDRLRIARPELANISWTSAIGR